MMLMPKWHVWRTFVYVQQTPMGLELIRANNCTSDGFVETLFKFLVDIYLIFILFHSIFSLEEIAIEMKNVDMDIIAIVGSRNM
jgi:hypothetical protein